MDPHTQPSSADASNIASPDAARHFSQAQLDATVFLTDQFTRVPKKRPIGTGSFGNIRLYYRGSDKTEVVVIKTPRYSEDTTSNDIIDRALKKDMKHLRLCRHPNILEYLGLYQGDDEGDELGIVCHYAEHQSLPTYLSNVQGADRLKIVREVAAGLAYLHRPDPAILVDRKKISIVHGDLHPANVLIMKDHRAVLGDFGLSKLCRDGGLFSMTNRGPGGAHGVAEYLAPEVHRAEDFDGAVPKALVKQHEDYDGKRTPKADVFSFGMLTFTTFGGDAKAMIKRAQVPTTATIALIEGSRPQLTDIQPQTDDQILAELRNRWDLVVQCWGADASKRPAMDEVCRLLRM